VHAAARGIPILGDTLYGGTQAARVFLHSQELVLRHPSLEVERGFVVPPDFETDPALALRAALLEPSLTNAFRMRHGAADRSGGWYLDQFNGFLLSQSEGALAQQQELERILARLEEGKASKCFPPLRGVYEKRLRRQIQSSNPPSPVWRQGERAPAELLVLENGIRFAVRFDEGYSVGLFLDQRDNRRRLLTGHVAADFELAPGDNGSEVLNTFAYTCSFSVCAARAGRRTTSLDLSRRYLEWGKRNFELNGLNPRSHDFIYGDVFDWLRRLKKKQRAYELIILDPPTFSRSKEYGSFQVERDFDSLVQLALPLLKPGGVLFSSCNASAWRPESFLEEIRSAIHGAKRRIQQEHYFPQPPDFPTTTEEPPYLKTVWMRLD
jgi:23S rRNA (cytosine1962-C5)-methyltransferase